LRRVNCNAFKAASNLIGLLLLLARASASLAQPAMPEMKHEHEPGYHHSFGNAETWAKEFDDPARDVWQKPDEILDALQLAPTERNEVATRQSSAA